MKQSTLAHQLASKVQWHDLIRMRICDGVIECLHPLPWLAASWWLASESYWPFALLCSFMFFLTALRLNHEAIHSNLGFSKRGHSMVMHGLSAVMLASNHSVAFNHRRHHAHIATVRDLEGKAGDMSLLQVVRYGPLFPVECHAASLREGDVSTRKAVRIDLALNLLIPMAALAFSSTAMLYHLAVMVIAQCFTALFAVWITHHGCRDTALVARSQRSRIINFLSYNMFFHLEHHMFPAVPVSRLPVLAKRMDAIAPGVAAQIRPVIGWRY